MSAVPQSADASRTPITYDRSPRPTCTGSSSAKATSRRSSMNVNEDKGLKPGYS